MHYGVSLVSGPTQEPITIAEAKAQCRIDSTNGEPAPGAPTVALAGLGAGNVNTGAHRYRITFVTADGETDGGIISDVVTTSAGNGQVALSAIPTGGSAVTSRKLYRTAAAGSTYLLLATIADNTTTTYADNIADASLGAAVPSTNTTADPELVSMIADAREYCEIFCRRKFLTQTLDLTLDGFGIVDSLLMNPILNPLYGRPFLPNHAEWSIRFPHSPVASITSITYVDTDGNTQTLDASLYELDNKTEPARLYPSYGNVWPATRYKPNAVTIRHVAGWASRDLVPGPIKRAIKLLVGHWNENREGVMADSRAVSVEIQMGVKNLLWSKRILEAA